jgi:hypothetical protein
MPGGLDLALIIFLDRMYKLVHNVNIDSHGVQAMYEYLQHTST